MQNNIFEIGNKCMVQDEKMYDCIMKWRTISMHAKAVMNSVDGLGGKVPFFPWNLRMCPLEKQI